MNISKLHKFILIISGLIGAYISIEILFFSISFYATSGIDLGSNVSLLNEIKAPGGSLLVCSILIISGVFIRKLTFTSIVLATTIYLSYGMSRMLSMVVDGRPADVLVYASVAELIIGIVCAIMLVKLVRYENKNFKNHAGQSQETPLFAQAETSR